MIGRDITRLRVLADKTQRVLTIDEAQAVAGYTRALLAVAKERKPLRKQGDDLDSILDEAEKIPILAEAARKIREQAGRRA